MKGYIFDFGGTLDTNGCHWGRYIWHAYERQHVPVNWEQFAEAYVYTERQLGSQPIIQSDDTFRRTLDVKIRIEMEHLVTLGYWYNSPLEQERLHAAVLDDIYEKVQKQTEESREVLLRLREKCPLVLCSNFYGNLQTVLGEFHLDDVFQDVVESAAVGIRKPDIAIYELALRTLGGKESAGDVTVVGDSLKNDIIPAKQLGCKTVWLKGETWEQGYGELKKEGGISDRVITDIKELV